MKNPLNNLTWLQVSEWNRAPIFKYLLLSISGGAIIVTVVNQLNNTVGRDLFSVPLSILILSFCAVIWIIVQAIYWKRCPDEIRKFGSKDKFIRAEKKRLKSAGGDKNYNMILTQQKFFDPELIQRLNKLHKEYTEEADPDKKGKFDDQLNTQCIPYRPKAITCHVQRVADQLDPKLDNWSKLCGILLALCFAGIAIVMLGNIIKIVAYVIETGIN